MADKKITQFEKFTGLGDTHTYFVIASGENAEPDTRNYRLDFVNMSEQVGQILFGGDVPFSGNEQCLHYGIFDTGDDRCINIDVSGDTKFSLRPDMGAFFKETLTVTGTLFSETLVQGDAAAFNHTVSTKIDSTNLWVEGSQLIGNVSPNILSDSDGDTYRLGIDASLNGSAGGLLIDAKTRTSTDDVSLLQIDAGLSDGNKTCFAVGANGNTAIGHKTALTKLDIKGVGNTFGANNEIVKISAEDAGSQEHHLSFGVDSANEKSWIRAYRAGSEENLHLQTESSTNGFVSIGKPTPLAKLHVGGNAIVEDDIHDSAGLKFAKINDIGDGTVTLKDQDGLTLGSFSHNDWVDTDITLETAPTLDPNGGLEETAAGLRIKDYGAGWPGGALFVSDKKFKSSISKIESPISIAKSISGVKFKWNEKADEKVQGKDDVGIIAQELEKVLPEAVSSNSKSELSVYYHKIIPVLLECIKDQQDQIDSLGKRISDLENG